MASAPNQSDADRAKRDAVAAAARSFDVRGSPAWQDLSGISNDIELDDVEVDPAGIVLKDDWFRGVMNLYVLLKFAGSGLESAESFPAFFEGRFDADGKPTIERLDVKTGSFFA